MTLAVPLEHDRSAPSAAERDDSPRRARAWWPLALAGVGALALAVGIAIVDALPAGVVADDAFYVILARALASGEGYRYLNVPGHPAGTHFPPGYPALLALVSFVVPAFPASVVAFKALNAAFLAAASVLVARLLRDRLELSPLWCLGVGAVTAISVPLLILGNLVLSELCFLALALGLLLALERLMDAPASARYALLLGAAIGVCALVRTHAVVLVPAAAVVLATRRRWREAALLTLAAVACLLPWQLWTARHGGTLPEPLLGMYDSYASWWLRGLRTMGVSMIPQTIAKTTSETSGMLAVLFSPMRGSAAHAVTLAALGSLVVAACIAAWRRMPVTLLFLAGYLAIVLVWPFQTARFVWTVWPLLLALVAVGGWTALGRPAWRAPVRAALAAAFVWVAVGYAAYEMRGIRGQWWSSIPRANTPRIATTVRWVLANTATDEVVATENEGAVYLYTGRQALPIITLTPAQYLRDYSPRENAMEGLSPVLDAYPVRTVVAGAGKAYDAAQFIASQAPARLVLRERLDGGAVFTATVR
ncbi:MAG TPA: hypothetical protein VFS59_10875 [Gemmatimonadaceae bacterium]|nr:hypothetical protein [Gemmatimonadaceae bacterium]